MLVEIVSKDQDVVQIHHYLALLYQVAKDVVHHSLESGWCIGETEVHDRCFE